MQLERTRAAAFAIGTLFCATILYGTSLALAQAPAPQTAASNDLQRSVEVFGYSAAAKSGATRGEVIYYYKCWNCHNDYTRAAGSPAPTLKGVFSRTTLVTGDPVNDENVAKQIRNGSPQMPSFGTALKDADIADILAYLHNGCCYEETNPPANPWYRANAQNSPAMPARGNLRGGPSGSVRLAAGDKLEGVMVQLISPQCGAYSNPSPPMMDGRYEFHRTAHARRLHLAHRQAAAVPALSEGCGAGRRRRQARRHQAAAHARQRFPAAHHRRAVAADGRRVGRQPGGHRRGEADLQPHLRGRAATTTTKSCATRSTSAGWRLMIFCMLHYSGKRLDRAQPPARQP